MKKLMILGGSRYVIPVIEVAHKLGIYVITCDYLPNNIAHKYSDEYVNVSIIDKEATLKEAYRLNIDGIISFACAPGVVTAAYIAEKMNLPFQCSYESAKILQDKGLFRKFLANNGFNCPHSKRYTDKKAPVMDIDFFDWPVIVKPVDSAGSKGVTKVENIKDLSAAIDIAIDVSQNGAFIIEDFLTFDGYHSSADLFTVDGKLKFVSYSDQLFDKEAENEYTPAYIIWPSSMKREKQDILTAEIQRLMYLLGMKTGIYNVESCVGINGKTYLMEVSPRGGGCKIAELQNLAYDTYLIENEVRKVVVMPLIDIMDNPCEGYWCEMVIHARVGESGILKEIKIDKDIKEKYVKVIDTYAKAGDIVRPFTGANMSLGDIFLRFDSRGELDNVVSNSNEWLHIDLV